MKSFSDAESVEGAIKMLAPIMEEGDNSCQNKFSMSLRKMWLREQYQSACNQKRTKIHTQKNKTMPPFKASSNTLFCGGEHAVGSKSRYLPSPFSLVLLLFLFALPVM